MNERVIEAAAKALEPINSDPDQPWDTEWWARCSREYAAEVIAIADATRAPDVRQAVQALELAAQLFGVFPSPQHAARMDAARRDLLRLVGCDGEHVTKGE